MDRLARRGAGRCSPTARLIASAQQEQPEQRQERRLRQRRDSGCGRPNGISQKLNRSGASSALRDAAEEQHLKPAEAARAQVAPQQRAGRACGRPGHHVALDPARALPDPGQGAAVRLFPRDGVDQFGPVAVAGQADAQIGILGHVVRIPAAQRLQRGAAEEQRGAAQRDRQAQALQAGQDHAEPGGVFEREAARRASWCAGL